MRFFSDNAAPVHPKIMQAIADANTVDTAYDGDALSQRLDAAFSELFERDVAVFWVSTGTAANCLATASARSMSASGSTTSSNIPRARASSGPTVIPV